MVYSNRFVMSVLVDGTPQRELDNGTVVVPFDTEYALRFRNKNSRRAVVKFFIDGEEVSGNGYIIPANDFIDIQRPSTKDAAFKFVGLDSPEAIDFGKNGPNTNKTKGVIEARFYLEREKPKPQMVEQHHWHHYNHYPQPYILPRQNHWDTHIMYCADTGALSPGASAATRGSDNLAFTRNATTPDIGRLHFNSKASGADMVNARVKTRSLNVQCEDAAPTANANVVSTAPATAPLLRDGCTVEGNGTGQRFSYASIDYDESNYTTLKVFLQGHDRQQEVEETIAERVQTALKNLSSKSEAGAKKNRVQQQQEEESSAPTQAEIEARAAEEEEARLRKLLAEKRAEKLRRELAELGVEA